MKLVTFTDSAGTRIGIVKDDGIVDLKKPIADLPRDMIGLMTHWPTRPRRRRTRRSRARPTSPLKRRETRAPIPRPGKDPGDRPQLRRPHRRERPEDARAPGLVLQGRRPRQRPVRRRSNCRRSRACSTTRPSWSSSSASAAKHVPKDEGARGHLRLLLRQRRHRARLAVQDAAMDAGQVASTPTRRSARGSSRPTRSATRTRSASAPSSTARSARTSNTKHLVFNIFDQIAHCQPSDDAGARRPDLHRHARRRRRRDEAAAVPEGRRRRAHRDRQARRDRSDDGQTVRRR